MKKKMLTGILAVSMLGLLLVGCGDNKEVTKTDESQVEITTETETPTEVETEAPTEEVKADFLAENGLTVTPNGSMTIPLAVKDTDDMIDVPITTSVETVASSEEGYSDTTLKVDIDAKAAAGQYCTQYDCALTADMNMDSNYVQHVTVTVHHPSNYNGVVFVFGGQTATQSTAYNAIDTSKTFTIADYSDVFIDGQYFFTATDK